jgi:hypothetical protein
MSQPQPAPMWSFSDVEGDDVAAAERERVEFPVAAD